MSENYKFEKKFRDPDHLFAQAYSDITRDRDDPSRPTIDQLQRAFASYVYEHPDTQEVDFFDHVQPVALQPNPQPNAQVPMQRIQAIMMYPRVRIWTHYLSEGYPSAVGSKVDQFLRFTLALRQKEQTATHPSLARPEDIYWAEYLVFKLLREPSQENLDKLMAFAKQLTGHQQTDKIVMGSLMIAIGVGCTIYAGVILAPVLLASAAVSFFAVSMLLSGLVSLGMGGYQLSKGLPSGASKLLSRVGTTTWKTVQKQNKEADKLGEEPGALESMTDMIRTKLANGPMNFLVK